MPEPAYLQAMNRKPSTNDTLMSSVFEHDKKLYQLVLTKTEILWQPYIENFVTNCALSGSTTTVPIGEVLRVTPETSSQQYQWHNKQLNSIEMLPCKGLTVHFVRRSKNHKWKLQHMTFYGQDSQVCESWVKKVSVLLSGLGRPKHLLIFINPVGGKRLAKKIFKEKVAPHFDLAGIQQTVVVTERANHAYDHLQTEDLSEIDGVVSVGGDGMVSEVVNGVLKRMHSDRNISESSVDGHWVAIAKAKPSMSVGIIPAGSTDTISYCTTGINDPTTSALHIVIGDQLPLDICSVWQDGEFLKYSISMAAYGFLGDVAEESERMRWLGTKRYDIAGFKTFMANRIYEGEISYRLSPEEICSPKEQSKCLSGCQRCASHQDEPHDAVDGLPWTTLTGQFISIVGANITCRCAKTLTGLSPNAHLGDGHMDLILIRRTSRYQYFRQMQSMAYKGDPFSFSFVDVCRVKEFKFTPQSSKARSGHGSWNVDGEVVSDVSSLHFRAHRQLINVYGRGIEELEESTACKPCRKSNFNESTL